MERLTNEQIKDIVNEFEEKIRGTLLFIQSISERELAEFIVHQSNAVEGLTKNNQSFVKAYHEIVDGKYLPIGKHDAHQRLCNYFNCSDSNDKQYPECEEQTTGRCQAIGVICALCKGE